MFKSQHLLIGAFAVSLLGLGWHYRAQAHSAGPDTAGHSGSAPADSLQLSASQSHLIPTMTVQLQSFSDDVEALGNLDVDANRSVAVIPPYSGIVARVLHDVGDHVHRGEVLYTVHSPDLVQAESTLIASAGVFKLDSSTQSRAQRMAAEQSAATRDVEQANADQQSADATFRAARQSLHVFGLDDAQIDYLLLTRHIDDELAVRSPLDGVVTSRSLAAGQLLQAGAGNAPMTVSDISQLWVYAYAAAQELPRLHPGQSASISIDALAPAHFTAHLDVIQAGLDNDSHKALLRLHLANPQGLLHPQMLASIAIHTSTARQQLALPSTAVVRENDGQTVVFVAAGPGLFKRRVVQLGSEQQDCYPVLGGLQAGTVIAANNALFLDTALNLQSE